MQAIVTSDSPRVNFTCLQLDTFTRDVRNSFQRWNDVREIRTVSSVRKVGGTFFYTILYS